MDLEQQPLKNFGDKPFYSSTAKSPSSSGHITLEFDMEEDPRMSEQERTPRSFMDTITGRNVNGGVFDAVENSNNYRFAVNASWAVNWFLLSKFNLYRSCLSLMKVILTYYMYF